MAEPTPTTDPSIASTPVTSQDTAPINTTQAPALEVKQAAETQAALNALFDEPTPTTQPVTPPVATSTETTSPDAKAAEAPKTTPVGADDFQSKLDAAKAPVGAHPNVAAGLSSLKELAQAEHAKAEALAAKVKDFETMAQEYNELKSGNKIPEPIEKDYNRLKDWEREANYQGTKEFQESYVKPVQSAETEVMGLLKQAGIKDTVEKFIKDNGGIIALSQSGELAGQSDNPDMTMAEWVDQQLLGRMPAVFKNRAVSKLMEAQGTLERGRAELQDFKSNAKDRWETKMKQMESDFNAGRDEALAEMGDLAKIKDIPSTATAEERVAAEAHNARIRKGAEQYEAYLKSQKDPRTAGKLLAKASEADILLGLYSELQARNKALEDKLNGIKAAGSHSQAGDHAPPLGTQKPSMGDLLKKTTENAMNDLFRATPTLT